MVILKTGSMARVLLCLAIAACFLAGLIVNEKAGDKGWPFRYLIWIDGKPYTNIVYWIIDASLWFVALALIWWFGALTVKMFRRSK